MASNPNPRANQEETKQPLDRDDSLRQPRRSVSSFWTDQMLFVIHYQLTNGTAALGNGARRSTASPVA